MAISNYERVTRALEILRTGLGPFVERELQHRSKVPLEDLAAQLFPNDQINAKKLPSNWDASILFKVITDAWHDVFKATLGYEERNLVSELRTIRNKWAHQQSFTFDDTYRTLDSAERLLDAVSAEPQAREIAQSKSELMRIHYEEQSRAERRKVTQATVEPGGSIPLPPWRDVITPHQDVATGNYQTAEFAADLWQVYLGQGTEEYQDPSEFYRRTYLTLSLKGLLTNAIRRLSGDGGDPVIQLQTNFGGGKTHSMLALYHLCSDTPPTALLGVEELMHKAEVEKLPDNIRRVVLVGTKISPASPSEKTDGTKVYTLWGELAYQLGGRDAYEMLRVDDESGTSPGDKLRELLTRYGPCLILIDEWVAYARQLHDKSDLAGGSFDTQFTFAQTLTEATTASPTALLVVSLPASNDNSDNRSSGDDIEVGGEYGRSALERLRNAVSRMESTWRPANADESFEIVRRRLFNPLATERYVDRDKVARAYSDLYRSQESHFPQGTREADYEKSIREAYPIHPEVFDRLYNDWSTLAKFQRTRGVLRLMAMVIHSLWSSGNSSPLIMPAHIPLDDDRVRSELTRYLQDAWNPVIDKDVDGANSLPVRMDSEQPNLGKYLASRRVTRTIFLGSAPTASAANRGIDVRKIKLGCVMPGEPPGVFDDALRRLASSATYIYHDEGRYWLDTQPTVTKLVEDRAEQLRQDPDRISAELKKLLGSVGREQSALSGVHLLPVEPGDVPEDYRVRLVILGPEHYYFRDPSQKSPAVRFGNELLESRGNAPRRFRNTLVFLAADQNRLPDLEDSIRRALAWQSVVDDKEALNLSPFQFRQAEDRKRDADSRVQSQIPETFCQLLIPNQPSPRDPVSINVVKISGTSQGTLLSKVVAKLKSEEALVAVLGGTVLRRNLDEIPLWQNGYVSIPNLIEYFASYTYLPRLAGPEVLYRAIESGVGLLTWSSETFAYADGYDEATDHFQGMTYMQAISIRDGDNGVLVRPTEALRQIQQIPGEETTPAPMSGGGEEPGPASVPTQPSEKKLRRYHASVSLDPMLASEASRIYQEILSHLTSAIGKNGQVKVSLEIEAENEDGFPESVVRVVNENGNTLKIRDHGFDEI